MARGNHTEQTSCILATGPLLGMESRNGCGSFFFPKLGFPIGANCCFFSGVAGGEGAASSGAEIHSDWLCWVSARTRTFSIRDRRTTALTCSDSSSNMVALTRHSGGKAAAKSKVQQSLRA
jgi:hypothetical protein